MVPLLLKTNIQAGQAAPLTNEGVRFFQCWFKIGCKLICNAWEGQSVCRGNNFTLLGIGEIPITVEVGWNQSSAVQPTTSVIAISVRIPDSGSEQIIGNFSHKIWISFLTFCRVAKYCNTNMESNLLKKSNDIRRQVIWSRLNWFKTWLGEQRCWTSVEHIHVSWFYGLWGGAGWGCGGGGNMEADGTDTTRRSKIS